MKKTNHHTWLPFFYYVIDTMYIYSWKEIDKKQLTHFDDAKCKKYIYFFLSHVVFNSTIEWTSRGYWLGLLYTPAKYGKCK